MSYIPKYLMDRMFNAGGVELDGTTLLITMNTMIRPIDVADIRNAIVRVYYDELDTEPTSPTFNEIITKNDRYGLLADEVNIIYNETTYTKDNIEASTETINIGDFFIVEIPNVDHVVINEVSRFRLLLKIYNPINLKFAKTVNLYVDL